MNSEQLNVNHNLYWYYHNNIDFVVLDVGCTYNSSMKYI